MRAFDKTTLSGAVGALGPGMRVLMPPGCGEPVALVEEIARQAARLADLTLMGGIHLGDYPYARPESMPPMSVRSADRKSTRLNSSHANISYAVFCLKKKK